MQDKSKNSVKKPVLIELQYFGPVQYFARLLFHEKVIFERYEHYQKATWRNRCQIAMPDGPLTLSIHLKDGRDQRRSITEVKICDTHKWRQAHWMSLCTAYRSSPYFEYYEDQLAPLFQNPHERLWDFSFQAFELTLKLLKVDLDISFTDRFVKDHGDSVVDLRSAILPNARKSRPDLIYQAPSYQQVFEPKIGFLPNLSVLDLLFSTGPNAADVLRSAMLQLES